MTSIAFFDCFSGISGDMMLGALIDAGLDIDQLRTELRKLNLEDWRLEAGYVVSYGIAGTHVHVRTREQQMHRHLGDIAKILHSSSLDEAVVQRALAVFERLADAEAAVHGTSRDKVHFHEVGALDAIIDIAGAVIGLKLLGIEQIYASTLPLGSGWVNAAHGRIPVPAPAVLELLTAVHAPITADDTPFELVTPTGAALLAELATFERPAFTIRSAGYGFGTRDIGRPNALRIWLGELGEQGDLAKPPQPQDEVVLIQTNIDDQSPEQLAYVAERLFERGVLDVWWTPIMMKKGRNAHMLSVLVRPMDEAAAVETIFRETTSLGVRRQPLQRWTCERAIRSVPTHWGPVRVKEQRWRDQLLGVAPEYEDCARIARAHNIPLRKVYAAVQEAIDNA